MTEALTAMVGEHGSPQRELAKHAVPAALALLRDHTCSCESCADCLLVQGLRDLTERRPISCALCMGRGHWGPDCQREGGP